MRVRIQTWGNNLVLKIPRLIAAEMMLGKGVEVALTLEAGRLVVTPATRRETALNDLLSRIATDNLHHEIDTGPAVGVENW